MFLDKIALITTTMIVSGTWAAPNALSQVKNRPLPLVEKLPLSPDNLCKGMPNVFAISKQEIKEQVGILCNADGTATATFLQAIATAYQGGPTDTTIVHTERQIDLPEGPSVELLYVQGLRVPKKAVQALLGQEKYVTVPYSGAAQPSGTLKNSQSFITPPPVNLNFADTAFAVEQVLDVNAPVVFKDVSRYDLRLYLVHPNNFDFFLAARTLQAKTNHFRSAVVVRAVIADKADPNYSYTVSVLHFKMNDHDKPDPVMTNVGILMRADLKNLYNSLVAP
jgi:hypothetical protein